VHDYSAAPADAPCRERADWMTQPSSVTSKPKQAPGSSTCTSHMPSSFSGWSVAPKGRPLGGGDKWLWRTRNGRCRGSKRKKSSSKSVHHALLGTRTFSGPRQGTGPYASRSASEDRPVRVRVQGPRRGARSARPMPRTLTTATHRPPFPSSSPAVLGRAGARVGTAGPCCGELWGMRATRVPGGRRPRTAAQRPLAAAA
jgi:hypothetical protein